MSFPFEWVSSGRDAKHIRLKHFKVDVKQEKVNNVASLKSIIHHLSDVSSFCTWQLPIKLFSAPCGGFSCSVQHKQPQTGADWFTVCRLKWGIKQSQLKITSFSAAEPKPSASWLWSTRDLKVISSQPPGRRRQSILTGGNWGLAGRLAAATQMHKVKWGGETDKSIKSSSSCFSCRRLIGRTHPASEHQWRLQWLIHWTRQSVRLFSSVRVEVQPTSTPELPPLPAHCLCNHIIAAAAAAIVSSHILSSAEWHEICSIQRTGQKNLPLLSSTYLVHLSNSPAAPFWTQLAQGGPISRFNGPCSAEPGLRAGGQGPPGCFSDTFRRQRWVPPPPPLLPPPLPLPPPPLPLPPRH